MASNKAGQSYHGINLSAHFFGLGEPLVETVSVRVSDRIIEFANTPSLRLAAAFYACFASDAKVFMDNHRVALHIYGDHMEVWVKGEGALGEPMVKAWSKTVPAPYVKKAKAKQTS